MAKAIYAEAERVKEMLCCSGSTEKCLFIINELFRGTNTRERVSAANAVLRRPNRNGHFCLLATHDLEVIGISAGRRWETPHCQEGVVAEGVFFDYALKPGVPTAQNALRLLERLGYPEEVVRLTDRTYGMMSRVSLPAGQA